MDYRRRSSRKPSAPCGDHARGPELQFQPVINLEGFQNLLGLEMSANCIKPVLCGLPPPMFAKVICMMLIMRMTPNYSSNR